MERIRGYENYGITSCGRVYNFNTDRWLKPVKTRDGYLQVYLTGHKPFLIHRLVAEHYLSNPNNLPEVNHKDENKQHNSTNNLEWCTHQYNCTYTRGKAIKYLKTGEIFVSRREAARKLNMSVGTFYRRFKDGTFVEVSEKELVE